MSTKFDWALELAARYDVSAGITYFSANGYDCKLNVYHPFAAGPPRPTVMFMHGGGWAEGSTKETWSLWFLPFLQLGWVVVNVDYRHSGVALAPAAVDDCLQALRWVSANAGQYQIDIGQLVIAGLSAGGHLALTTGMIPPEMLADELKGLPKAAAIVNWCGVADIGDLAAGPHRLDIAVKWLGNQPDLPAIIQAVSPLSYVRAGLPPIITIHGDQDEVVPFSQAVRLHEALAKAGVTQELIRLPGAVHASLGAYLSAYPRILEFLARAGVKVET